MLCLVSVSSDTGLGDPTFRVFTQMTRRQHFDVMARMDWTIFLMLAVGHHVKFDSPHQNFDASVKTSDAALPV